MPKQWTFTVQLLNGRLRVIDEAQQEPPFSVDPSDTVVWKGDTSVGLWTVIFRGMKTPFAANKRWFAGDGVESTDPAHVRNAPDDYDFSAFALKSGTDAEPYYLDPILVVRPSNLEAIAEDLRRFATSLEGFIPAATGLAERADLLMHESLTLAAQIESAGTSPEAPSP